MWKCSSFQVLFFYPLDLYVISWSSHPVSIQLAFIETRTQMNWEISIEIWGSELMTLWKELYFCSDKNFTLWHSQFHNSTLDCSTHASAIMTTRNCTDKRNYVDSFAALSSVPRRSSPFPTASRISATLDVKLSAFRLTRTSLIWHGWIHRARKAVSVDSSIPFWPTSRWRSAVTMEFCLRTLVLHCVDSSSLIPSRHCVKSPSMTCRSVAVLMKHFVLFKHSSSPMSMVRCAQPTGIRRPTMQPWFPIPRNPRNTSTQQIKSYTRGISPSKYSSRSKRSSQEIWNAKKSQLGIFKKKKYQVVKK